MKTWFPSLKAVPVGLPWLALSNIRGQLSALERVLSGVCTLKLAGIFSTGNHCLGGSEPFAVWQRLRELDVHLVRGKTDLALGTLKEKEVSFLSFADELQWRHFLQVRQALGDLICRRLSELPKTEVVSLGDKSGIMVQHVLPADERRELFSENRLQNIDDENLTALTTCVAEDVLVFGAEENAFQRCLTKERVQPLWVISPGSVGAKHFYAAEKPQTNLPTATLIQAFSDQKIRAVSRIF